MRELAGSCSAIGESASGLAQVVSAATLQGQASGAPDVRCASYVGRERAPGGEAELYAETPLRPRIKKATIS